jgi:UDP-2-acetamido-2-deoxy-ribo-hexuluronate aminotransferase
VIRVPERRDQLAAHLRERGIETAVHYPLPLHLQPALASLGYGAGDFPHAERASRESLALPMFPELSDAQLSRVAEAVTDFFR